MAYKNRQVNREVPVFRQDARWRVWEPFSVFHPAAARARGRLGVVLCALLLLPLSSAYAAEPAPFDMPRGPQCAQSTPPPETGGTGNVHVVLPESVPEESAAPVDALKSQAPLSIQNWQGAKNYLESFPVTVAGGTTGGALRFLTTNCSVSPSTGAPSDTYRVTVAGAGSYSLTAIMAGGNGYREVSETRTGVAGKADQEPLYVTGWGGAKDYYRSFSIVVEGGTTGGKVHFEGDGCAVLPATGPVGSAFMVTVTRVGSYTLTAVMDGGRNYQSARSTQQCGMSGKSSQTGIVIGGWEENVRYGATFTVDITGGNSGEPLSVTASGCTAEKVSGGEYAITVNTVGPYTLTAKRPGNYGYLDAFASACGISKQAYQPALSVSGWSGVRNVSDAFPIRVNGGLSDGTVHFAASGCTVSPATGAPGSQFMVTVNTVGPYSLTAYMDGTANYAGVASTKLTGVSGKAPQKQLSVSGWDDNAYSGSSFDIQLMGGSGNGATSITTASGCTAIRKSGASEDVYTVTVIAKGGAEYSLSAVKSGDVNYQAGASHSVLGTAGDARQAALKIAGWSDTADSGEVFTISISGGSGDGKVSFEADGCTVSPLEGGVGDDYSVTVAAAAGSLYSLTVNRAGTGGYARATLLKSGNVRPANLRDPIDNDEMVMLGNDGYEVWLWTGIVLVVLIIITGFLLFKENRNTKRRRRA